MNKDEIPARVARAVEIFESGYTCSQAVLMAYADVYKLDMETAASIATSFGGGMGRLREVCGAVSGMFMVLGLHYPSTDVSNKKAKIANYEAVQRTAKRFQQEMGSYICADLLKIKRQPDKITPSDRNAHYYALRPCSRCVAVAATILGEEIASESE
ncbi:C-GCAxxG-C-C family protein [Microbacter margulisiae]|uniref:C_GCAxxG_C_C family probable redox protein n=1 Tax=Microbacter margulisiae TaxID=1350067 RepID=A0A7W5DR91_9PORP|nr:C-GCAxxG-C-C family protein [Microbacter margulisiae]MBB3187615.1 C_GCAxxG_C_C family probable redox protein [Microbacter margulisiae]